MIRHLAWEGCVNIRDLGGLPIEGGSGRTRSGVVVRADDISALSEGGWRQLDAYGVRTAVDLRFPEERSPHPPYASELTIVGIPLFGRIDRGATTRIDAMIEAATDGASALALLYVDALERHRARIVAAVGAVASGSETGAVVVHCAVGKDRTGIVAALLLRLAGVSVEHVAEDYALSHERVGPLVDSWVASAEDPRQHEIRRRLCAAPLEGMLRTLEALEEAYGGAERYLGEAGMSRRQVDALRERLSG